LVKETVRLRTHDAVEETCIQVDRQYRTTRFVWALIMIAEPSQERASREYKIFHGRKARCPNVVSGKAAQIRAC
jgi:hypothetical protein